MNKQSIYIIGGYGAVGETIAINLSESYPQKVIVVGRNIEKAIALSQKSNGNIIPFSCDISKPYEYHQILNDALLVIMCLDQKNTDFVQQCISNGIHYIDITADFNFLTEVSKMSDRAQENRAKIILSVGLAPGITNLLAKYCKLKLVDPIWIDINILLGLGERHGTAAYKWIFNNLNAAFNIKEGNTFRKVKSLGEGKKIFFSKKVGNRYAYRFNFSDQHVVAITQQVSRVSTRLCFDSKFITRLIVILKRLRLTSIFEVPFFQNIAIKTFNKIAIGSDLFTIKVIGENELGEKCECSFSGNVEGKITGLIASEVAKQLLASEIPAGVHHIDEVFNPVDIFYCLKKQDRSLEIDL